MQVLGRLYNWYMKILYDTDLQYIAIYIIQSMLFYTAQSLKPAWFLIIEKLLQIK